MLDRMNLDLFYRDPYLLEWRATVLACTEGPKGFEVILDQTIFYPEGGGQPADHGKIDDATLTDTRRIDGKIVHFCDKALEVGKEVVMELDWDRRYDHMQNHSGEHLLSGLVHKEFGYDNVGFHMSDDVITCDFNGELSDEDLERLETKANNDIRDNNYVLEAFPSPEELAELNYRSKKELKGAVRIIEIPGVDCCACCGLHVNQLVEIGMIKILSSQRHRGGTRVEFVCGPRALHDYRKKIREARRVSALLSAKVDEIGNAVEKLLADSEAKNARIAALTRELLTLKADAVTPSDQPLVLFESDMAPLELRNFAALLKEKEKAPVVAVLSATDKETYSYVIAGPADIMRDASKALNKKLCGRGGGANGIVQGSFKADADAIRAAVAETFAA